MTTLIKGLVAGILLVGTCTLAVEWDAWVEVKEVYISTDGAAFITLASLPSCYNNQGAQLKGSNIDRAYSTMLAAFMAKKKVRPLYVIKEGATGWDMCTISSFFIAA